MEKLNFITINNSLILEDTYFGIEKELVFIASFTILFGVMHAYSWHFYILMGLFFLIFLSIGRKITKADPKMFKTLMAYFKYRKYYPANTNPFAASSNRKIPKKRKIDK